MSSENLPKIEKSEAAKYTKKNTILYNFGGKWRGSSINCYPLPPHTPLPPSRLDDVDHGYGG